MLSIVSQLNIRCWLRGKKQEIGYSACRRFNSIIMCIFLIEEWQANLYGVGVFLRGENIAIFNRCQVYFHSRKMALKRASPGLANDGGRAQLDWKDGWYKYNSRIRRWQGVSEWWESYSRICCLHFRSNARVLMQGDARIESAFGCKTIEEDWCMHLFNRSAEGQCRLEVCVFSRMITCSEEHVVQWVWWVCGFLYMSSGDLSVLSSYIHPHT